jgi:putative transposase
LKRLRRLLRSNGIFHRYHRKYIATTDSNHNLARLPNLVDRQFNCYAINQAWCGDITYIPIDEGWLFMASVLDLVSCYLVSYSFDSTMKTSLVVDALRMAIANEHPAPGLIFHSDQGSQYCSHVFLGIFTSPEHQWLYEREWAMLGQRCSRIICGNLGTGNATVNRML